MTKSSEKLRKINDFCEIFIIMVRNILFYMQLLKGYLLNLGEII